MAYLLGGSLALSELSGIGGAIAGAVGGSDGNKAAQALNGIQASTNPFAGLESAFGGFATTAGSKLKGLTGSWMPWLLGGGIIVALVILK